MTDKFTAIIKEAQDIMSNLFEVEYYGANDVEEEQNNKIKRQGKDKHGNKVDLVSVQDELFPYEGNAKEQYNKKIIAKINDMIEGKATLEDLIQLVRNKKTPVKEAQEILEEEIKKERKNNKQKVFRRMDDPEKNKIGVKKNYNRVIHNDSASKDPSFDYVKIKGTKYQVDKYGQIGAPVKEGFEGAIELLEALLQDTKAIRRNKELNAKRAEKKAKELKKQRNELDRKEQIAFGDAATLKDLADYHTDTNGRDAEETKNVRSNAADAIKKHRNVLKELKKVANDYSNATLDAIHNKYQARRAQDKVNMLTDR